MHPLKRQHEGVALRLIEIPQWNATNASKVFHFLSCKNGEQVEIGAGTGATQPNTSHQRLHLAAQLWPPDLCRLQIIDGTPHLYRSGAAEIKLLSRETEVELLESKPRKLTSGDFLVYGNARIRFFHYPVEVLPNREEKENEKERVKQHQKRSQELQVRGGRQRSKSPERDGSEEVTHEVAFGQPLSTEAKVLVVGLIVLLLGVLLVLPEDPAVVAQRRNAGVVLAKLGAAGEDPVVGRGVMIKILQDVISFGEARVEEVVLLDAEDSRWVDHVGLYDEDEVQRMYNELIFKRSATKLVEVNRTNGCWWIPPRRNAQVVLSLGRCVKPLSFESTATRASRLYVAEVFGISPTVSTPRLLVQYEVQPFFSSAVQPLAECIDRVLIRLNASTQAAAEDDGLCVHNISLFS